MPEDRTPNYKPYDTDLAVLIRDGDVAAYAAAFRTYYLSIVRFLTRYLPEDSAEDVAQDVFVRVWETRANIDPSRSFKAYLFTTARNRALNLLAHDDMVRHHADAVVRDLGEDAETSREPRPDEVLVASELAAVAETRIATLSPRLREVYHLSRNDGLSAAEIADVLGTSVHTVYVQLAKVTQALHPVLRGWLEE